MKTPKFPVLPLLLAFAAVAATGCSSDKRGGVSRDMRAEYEAKRATHVVVVISENNRVKVDGERFSPKELPDVFKNKARVHRGRPVLLLVQRGVNADATTFVKKHAASAGLGPVEVMVAE